MAYRVVLAGYDSSSAKLLRYGYNITLIVPNIVADFRLDELHWDYSDLDRLSRFFPEYVLEGKKMVREWERALETPKTGSN